MDILLTIETNPALSVIAMVFFIIFSFGLLEILFEVLIRKPVRKFDVD